MRRHYLTMSASDAVARCIAAFSNAAPGTPEQRLTDQRDWAEGILTNAAALELLQGQIQHSNQIEVDVISRVLATRAYQLRETYEEDRPQLWFLDMFRNRGLFFPLERGVSAMIFSVRDYAAGEVAFVGDKTDDWPTEGAASWESTMQRTKYFGKAIEYGIFELWEASRNGRDIVAERTRYAWTDMDEFLEKMIVAGAPAHSIYGFMNHPSIPFSVVAGGTWLVKTPEQIIADLYLMRDSVRTDSNYNAMADTMVLSDQRYSTITNVQIGTNGDNIWSRWVANQNGAVNGGMTTAIPFVPYDTAGPGNTPIAMVGTFNRDNIEMPLLPPEQLPVEYHGAKWKLGFVGGLGSVNVKRKGRFRTFRGI